MRLFRPYAILACLSFAACGGGGGRSAALPPANPVSTSGPASKSVTVALAVAIPAKIGSAKARNPLYVSSATASIQISVNGSTAQTFAVGSGSPCATGTSSPSGTCAVYDVTAAVGTDTFAVSLLDGANHVLSSGSATATIVENATNTVNVTFDGVVASLRVALSNPTPPTGTAAKIAVTLLPLDAAGYTIVGSPGTLPSITVTDSDTSGATGLYLAGSDGTCGTQAAAPATSVTTTQSGAQYQQVCASYTGGTLADATIAATVAGTGQQGSAKLSPSAPPAGISVAGVWVMTYLASGETLERLDPDLTLAVRIDGSNTVFGSEQATAISVLPSGNVAVLAPSGGARSVAVYSGTAGGNVAPLSVTSLPTAAAGDAFTTDPSGYALTVAATPANPAQNVASSCTIYRTALTNGDGSSALAGTCTNLVTAQQAPVLIHAGPNGRIYLSVASQTAAGTPPTLSYSIFRYVQNSDGSLTPEAAITLANDASVNGFAFDPSGNVVVASYSAAALLTYSASAFVSGQNTTVSPIASNPIASSNGLIAIDPSGNTYVSSSGLAEIPSGSTSVANRLSVNPTALAAPTTVAPAGGGQTLSPSPASVSLDGSSRSVTVTESGYTGSFSQVSSCAQIATVTPATAAGPVATFTVTPGSVGGTCTITFEDDGQNHSAPVSVGNTVTAITGQSARRKH